MKSKKLIVGIIAASLVIVPTATAFATGAGINLSKDIVIEDVRPISTPIREVKRSNFNSYAGKVKSIKESETQKGTKIVIVEDKQGGEAHFNINEKTYFINNKEIKEGLSITGYYDATKPMIMIYPAQYTIDAVVVGDIKETVKVDLFDDNLISKDNQLKINVDKDTTVITEEGGKYKGKLNNKNLVVIYDIATKSIPAQTSPIKVVVLDKEPVIENNDDVKNGNKVDTEVIKLLRQIIRTFLSK